MALVVDCGPADFLGARPGRGAGLRRGRPASRPRRELRSALRLVVRPGPAAPLVPSIPVAVGVLQH